LALKDVFASDASKDDTIHVVTPQKVDFANGTASKDPDILFPETEVDDDPSIADFENFLEDDMSMLYGEGTESRQEDESSLDTSSQKEDAMTPPSVNADATVVSNNNNNNNNNNNDESDPVLLDHHDNDEPPPLRVLHVMLCVVALLE
jgi:hypothetical protein